MKKSFRIVLIILTVVICFGLCSCGIRRIERPTQPPEPTTTEEPDNTIDFTTTDGLYKVTTEEGWSEISTYNNENSTLELETGGGLVMFQLIRQQNSGLQNSTLEPYSREVAGYFVGKYTGAAIESTETVYCGSYQAIRNIITVNLDGRDYVVFHTTAQVGGDFIQFIVITTESNRINGLLYSDEIPKTITPL